MELIQLDVVEQWAWVGWLALVAVLLALETASGELTFLMLALGGGVGLVSSLVGAPLWMQIIIAAVAAAAFMWLLRSPLLRYLRRSSDPQKFNVDALAGRAGVVTETVTTLAGRVTLVGGGSWSARVLSGPDLPPRTPVVVQSIEGATAIVAASPGTPPASPPTPQEV